MKPIIPFALLGALLAVGAVNAAETTPVGYYNFDAKAGGNLFVPGFVNAAVFSGALVADAPTTLTLAANSLTANALNQLPAAGLVEARATHYVEITQAGANQGVVIDIVSNTASEITLAKDIAALNLAGTETITIRPHVTLKSVLLAAEANLSPFTDSVTFYPPNGISVSYTYGGDFGTGWSSDFTTADGNTRPVPPGTGFVLGVGADVALTVTGEVKASPVVVQLPPGIVNIVGPINPLVGSTTPINAIGWGALAPFNDSITVYDPGLITSVSYSPLGDVNQSLTTDFSNPTTDTFDNTTGAVIITADPSSVRVNSGL